MKKQLHQLVLLFTVLSCSGILNAQTVTDYEGNVYNTVTIGTQTWMSDNVRSTKYADGTDVNPQYMSPCNGDNSTVTALGYLYTWPAMMKEATTESAQGICPTGWHVPSLSEYNILINYLGGSSVAGKKMKSTNLTYWDDITYNDNSSGFNAHGGGHQNSDIYFYYRSQAKFWTSTEDGTDAKEIQIQSSGPYLFNLYGSSKTAIKSSCRCVKNSSSDINLLDNNIEFKIYPNPTTGIVNFSIESKDKTALDLIIYDILGKAIFSGQMLHNQLQLDMSHYGNGIYFYLIKSNDKIVSKGKFSKE